METILLLLGAFLYKAIGSIGAGLLVWALDALRDKVMR